MPAQPYDIAPPLQDTTIVGAWLNTTVRGRSLGADASPAGDDMTPVGKPTNAPVGVHLVAASLQYLRRVEADWRPDSFGVVSAWIKLDSIGTIHRIFTSAEEAGDDDYWAFGVDAANHLTVAATIGGTSNGVAGDSTLVADRWYRVSCMSDGGTWALYLDTNRETLTPSGAGNDGSWLSAVPNRGNVCIGALRTMSGVLEYFDGSIKDVRYRGLTVDTQDIVTREYARGVPDDTLALWTIGGQTDLSKYANTFVHNNGPTTGHEMRFDGASSQSIQSAALELTSGMTVSLWFNATAFGAQVLFNNVIHLNRRLVILLEAAGEIRAGYWTGAVYRSASGAAAYTANHWHHAYCTWDADETCRLWVDMVEQTGTTDPSSGNALTLRLGTSTGGTSPFDGRMRDARVWQADKGEAFGQTLYEMTQKYY